MELVNQKQFLIEHPIFQMLNQDQMDRLLKEGELQLITKHHFVIHEKQDNQNIFLLLQGVAKNTFINDHGEEMAVLFYHPGDLIGIISAVTHRKTQFAVQALSDLHLLRLSHDLFSEILRENLAFSEKMVRMVSQRLDNLYEKLQEESSYVAHGLDTYPYRKKIGEIMSSPVHTGTPDETVLELAKMLLPLLS
ncbi:cyclic nucleotide-binding domain-containing protein [Ammoniphilus sp. 3BR4]|uniref:cyclic nucleotide-binding domain-containing protein n=1 Tax=Ammoniphilus sp. 3BR4 TaxID=3158265 RepID=UPI003465EE83